MSEPAVIVSLTSISTRLGYLPAVIGSILNQTRPPERVILNLSAEPYLRDTGVTRAALPRAVLAYETQGLVEICWVQNTGPYRKLLPVLREKWGEDCVIVTADDDTLYPSFWLQGLYDAFLAHRCVTAYRCHRMRFEAGKLLPYKDWVAAKGGPVAADSDLRLFPAGKDGVLYHPSFFTEAVFDPELIRLAPTTDDITFKIATMITRTKVTAVAYPPPLRAPAMRFPALADSAQGLWRENQAAPNDQNLARLLDYLQRRGVLDTAELFADF